MHRKFRFYLILALLISIILEITLFNYTHYATLFTSEHFNLAYNKQERSFGGNVNYFFNGISLKDSLLLPDSQSELRFRNLNTELASIYINPIFIQGDKQRLRILWADEESSTRSIDVSIIKDLDFSNYIAIAPRGKVSNLNIQFLDNNIAIKEIELNKKIPMAIMPIRSVIVFCISLLLLCLLNAEFREKISYFCFDYMYDKTNFRQRIGFAMLVCSMLIVNFLASYSVFNFRDNELVPLWTRMYSHNMTDALLKRQLHLDIKVPQALLKAERPYDDEYRRRNGLSLNYYDKRLDYSENTIPPDVSFYNGKFYSHFGMVPVIILFAPYKLITGDYLPSSIGTFLFGSIATVLLMLLWKQIAHNYLKNPPYFFFLIGGAVLYAASSVALWYQTPYFHLIAQYSSLTFVILGVIILLQAKEKFSIKLLFASSFSFALAVACRPSALFWSILIPVALWDKRRELINTRKYMHLLAIIIPFVIVGSILAGYNYARFDSPFSFGEGYMLQTIDQRFIGILSPIGIVGKIHLFIKTFLFVLFNPPNLDLTYPFVTTKVLNVPLPSPNFFHEQDPIMGIFCFPIMWFLFYAGKVDILKNFIFAGIFVSLLNITQNSFFARNFRYAMDYSWILAIGALICAFQLQEKEVAMRKVILKAFYSSCGITLLLVFFFITYRLTGDWIISYNPKIHHYLARTFGVICNVP